VPERLGETSTMTRTANTTSTVPKSPAVLTVLRLEAFFAVAPRGPAAPALIRLTADRDSFTSRSPSPSPVEATSPPFLLPD
jgi:hypothetical protein